MAAPASNSSMISSSELAKRPDPLTKEQLELTNAYWRASNYLTVGQIYLRENPLLRSPLEISHIKPRLLGHFGTSPGLNLLYVHANRVLKQVTDRDFIFMVGPGHGGPAIVAQVYLEGTWEEVYPHSGVKQDIPGMRKLFRQFSAPGGIPSHCSPDVPGSIHEGGELGYVLSHAFGSVLDNPDLITLAVVGDGEAETGPLEGSWKGITFLNPVHDGAVLPVMHLNGYMISGPTIFGRESNENIASLFKGHGYEVLFVEGDQPDLVHQQLAKTMDYAVERIRAIQKEARAAGKCTVRPRWPLIIMRTPKGWTGPKSVDGKKIEGTNFSHQVPLAGVRETPAHLVILEQWMKSYKPEELFTAEGRLKPEIQALAPQGDRRMSAQPYTNGGKNSVQLKIPDLAQFALDVKKAAAGERVSSVLQLGALCNELYKSNPTNFRVFCPDETNSNKLGAVFQSQKRSFMLPLTPWDDAIGPEGRVMEVLSEHLCQGWMEGYLLTGRHGILATYESFAMVMISMVLQSIKWFEVVAGDDEHGGLTWRKQLPSINILLTSTCWRNDHNGFSHQGPSFIDCCLNSKGSVVRAYFPVDANSLLAVSAHCFETRNRVNVIVQDKQVQLQYLTMEQAIAHEKAGISKWDWASTDKGEMPDVIIACCGDVMTMEALAAAAYLRKNAPGLKVRFINVMDLMRLPLPSRHPHGMKEADFDALFTDSAPIVFAYHSHPNTLHQLIHNRTKSSERFHVRGFQELGTTTTPFDMVVLNSVSRFHLAKLALERCNNKPANAAELIADCVARVESHKKYVVENMEDQPEIANFKWEF